MRTSPRPRRRALTLSVLLVLLAGCSTTSTQVAPAPDDAAPQTSADRPQYESTYERIPHAPVLIRNATILTATGEEIERGAILFRDGVIEAVGADVPAPPDATVIDGTGKFVTPGIIDSHSHLGVYATPGTAAESDGNEAVRPNTAHVWAE